MKPGVTNYNEIPNFQNLARNKNKIKTSSSELDLMILDIGNRERKLTFNDKFSADERVSDDIDHYLAKELLEMNRNPLMMRSLFLPDEEDVYFNNSDRTDMESDSLISDEDIMKKIAPENKFRGNKYFCEIFF